MGYPQLTTYGYADARCHHSQYECSISSAYTTMLITIINNAIIIINYAVFLVHIQPCLSPSPPPSRSLSSSVARQRKCHHQYHRHRHRHRHRHECHCRYGDTEDDPNSYSSGILQRTKVKVVTGLGGTLPTFYTKSGNSLSGTCNGDSGGPAMFGRPTIPASDKREARSSQVTF